MAKKQDDTLFAVAIMAGIVLAAFSSQNFLSTVSFGNVINTNTNLVSEDDFGATYEFNFFLTESEMACSNDKGAEINMEIESSPFSFTDEPPFVEGVAPGVYVNAKIVKLRGLTAAYNNCASPSVRKEAMVVYKDLVAQCNLVKAGPTGHDGKITCRFSGRAEAEFEGQPIKAAFGGVESGIVVVTFPKN